MSLVWYRHYVHVCCVCRSPKDYFAVVDSLENKEADGRYSHFELISCKCVDTYVRVKKNQSQICWKWKKVSNRLHTCSQATAVTRELWDSKAC